MKKLVALTVSLTWLLTAQAAINISGFNTFFNDRFSNSSDFIADQFDLSGVAYNGTGPSNSGWLTMISRNVYITAQHARPALDSVVTFYGSNDPEGFSVTRTVTNNRIQIGTTDISVGTLSSPLPESFAFYNFATETITNNNQGGPSSFGGSPYSGENAYVFGRSPTTWPVSQNMAVGRNILDRFLADFTVPGANSGDAIGANIGGANAVDFEAQLATGDSGGPLMVAIGNALTIVGVNWFTGTINGTELFGASYLGNVSDSIQSFIDANPVPELRQFSLMAGLMACFFTLTVRRRCRRLIKRQTS